MSQLYKSEIAELVPCAGTFFLLVRSQRVRSWWGDGRYLFAVPYLVAAIPLVVLHAGAIKNDLMTQFFALSAVLWGGRWLTTRRFDDAALCIVALFAGVGTKNHVLLLAGLWGIVFLARERLANLVRLAPVALAMGGRGGGRVYGAVALVLSAALLVLALDGVRGPTPRRARRLFLATLTYLPALLGALVAPLP